jgi:hypothetical protein
MRAVREADGAGRPGDLLHGHAVLQIAKADTAVRFCHGDAVQAERAHLRPEFSGKPVLPIDACRQRCDPFRGKPGHAFAQHVRRFPRP